MKKKFLALVLTLAMVLSLVPVTALATNGTEGGASQENTSDNLTMKKTVIPNEDGTYTVRLESYATGEVKTTTTTEPRDIVLLLDVSGSMNDPFTQSSSEYRGVYRESLERNKTYYVKSKNKYKEVKYCSKCDAWTNNCKVNLFGVHKEGKKFIPKVSEDDTDVTHTQFYEYVYTEGQSKMSALKQAVNKFIDDIAQNSPNSNVSIVKFAGKESSDIGDSKYQDWPYTYNYTQVVKDLTQVNLSGATALKNAVSALNAAGATSSDYGLEKAQAVLNSESATQKKVIILFTDGEPNHDSGFDCEVATNAVNTAKTLKGNDTTIYTVGVFKDPSNDVNQYMSSVSSNYPNATAKYTPGENWWENGTWTVKDGGPDPGTYYKTADSAADLIKAFQTISSQVSSTNLNGNAVVVDKVPSNFKAPANAKDVTLKVANYKADGTFDTATDAPDEIRASVNGNGTVSVTGFNFSENWCGLEGDTAHGQKLIIEFNIKCTNYGGTQPTNAEAYIKADSKEDTEKIIDLKNPEVPVTVQLPERSNPYTDTKTYDGAGFDIKDEIGKIIAGLVPVDGTKNEFIDLTYEIKDSSGKLVGTYTISAGQTTGTWSTDSTEITTSPNVGEYKYTIIVTGQDKKQPSNKDRKECTATFTITKKEEVSYTVIFNANGGTWDNGDKTVTQPYESSSSFVRRPTNDPKKSGSTFVDWAYKDAEGTFHSIGQNPFMGIRVSMLQQLSGVTGNSVTLYAVWKDNDTAPTGSLNYRINQYFIDETGKVANSISKPGRNTVDTAISTLISDLIPQDRSFPNYQYKEAKTTVNNEKYNGNEKLAQDDTVINLYYYLDNWKDADKTSDEKDEDSATGGDGIPDCQQVKIQYLVYKENGGTVSRKVEIATFDNDTLNAIHGSTAKANSGFTFVTWSGRDVAVNDITVDNVIATTEPKSGPDFKPSPTELVKGNAYTYTAIFLEDKIGDRNDDGTDKGDEIPDRYQVTINYVDDNTGRGKITGLTKEVKTIYVNGKEGKWASTGKVTASGSTAEAIGSKNYFSNWTDKTGKQVDTSATLREQAIDAKGGETYTFTANFGRSSGSGSGGSNRPKPPVVEIPDDVPTGLNGKDHYAYVVGYPDGMVYPQKNITRAEVATIFFRLLKDETREANMTKSNSYNDMKDGAWYTCAVSTLSKMGIIKGYEDGSFKPDASISRAEFAAIAARFDPDGDKTPATFSDVSSHWAKDEISIAANHGWIKGYEDGSFKPDQKITRAETMTLVNRVLKRLPETKDDLHKDMKTWPDNQNESAWFYLAVQEATNSHYQKLKKDGTHETWESMRETRDWAALEK